MILNRKHLLENPGFLSTLAMSIANRMANNTLATSLHNIEAHYDLSNGMFQSFLSSDMMYSCAIFDEEEGGLDGDVKNPQLAEVANDKLHEAQMRKVRQTIEKAQIRKGDRVLDIGGGWGTFAIEVSRSCREWRSAELTARAGRAISRLPSRRHHSVDRAEAPCRRSYQGAWVGRLDHHPPHGLPCDAPCLVPPVRAHSPRALPRDDSLTAPWTASTGLYQLG